MLGLQNLAVCEMGVIDRTTQSILLKFMGFATYKIKKDYSIFETVRNSRRFDQKFMPQK